MAMAMDFSWFARNLCEGAQDIPSNKGATSSSANLQPKMRSWGEDPQKIVRLMMGKPSSDEDACRSEVGEIELDLPLPCGWEKRLDLKSGSVYFVDRALPDLIASKNTVPNSPPFLDLVSDKDYSGSMANSKAGEDFKQELERNNHQNLDLELNLGIKAAGKRKHSEILTSGASTSASKNPFQCAISDHSEMLNTTSHSMFNQFQEEVIGDRDGILTGCKSCLMYVIISRTDPQCPRCGSSPVSDIFVPSLKRSKAPL